MSMSNNKKRGQRHQNTRKFQLNDESKLTKRIKKTPLDLLCQRCYDQIKWKIEYKKYKPLSQPGKCVDCKARNILKAYRALCDTCATKKVEIRVPRAQAVEMGLITPTVAEGAQAAALQAEGAEEVKQEVAEQVIVEEANEEEETKETPASETAGTGSGEAEEGQTNAQDEEGAAAAEGGDGDGNGNGDGDEESSDDEEDESKALTLEIQKQLNLADPMVKTSRCTKCTKPVIKYATQPKTRQQEEEQKEREYDRIDEICSELKERMKRKVMRQIQNGEIDYDAKLDKLVYADTKEEFEVKEESDIDSDEF